jgi:hypothetical protein
MIARTIDTLANTSMRAIQDRGYHFQKRDYYSALNDLPFLSDNSDFWHDRPLPRSIEWDVAAELDEVRRIALYLAELEMFRWIHLSVHRAITGTTPSGVARTHWSTTACCNTPNRAA